MSWGYYRYYKKTTPRTAKGGIKAQSKRGKFAESWWAKRWINVLESFDIGARLGRGRSYARNGQVTSIEIEKGRVKAKVQGSRRSPYKVLINVKTIPDAKWKKLAEKLKAKAIFVAKLLSGEMPQEIEKTFGDAGSSLFPEKRGELQTDCSCPDWSNPCKHIAAVYYLIGEEFDRNPFLIFKLRGMERDELVGLIGDTAGKASKNRKTKRKPAISETVEKPPEPAEPLASDRSAFWEGSELPEDILGEARIPTVTAALPKRLGNFPFWRGDLRFIETLEPFYEKASQPGMNIFLGELEIPG